ncbi:hypothetical protein FQR65_LT11192 [Abscondita terminalis]|nr:hypothetical protein FQR65_LT11192 [Abscondita terminalis]
MEEEECAKMLNHLQQYVPHLEKLIAQLKDPKKKNRELQLSKLEGLHSMITDRKKKLKLDTLRKCEDVILKILQKVHPNIYKQSEPHFPKFYCKDPPAEKSFLSDDDLMNSVRLQVARARLNEISTPASPSPPRDVVALPPPIVIPTEKVTSRKLDTPWERREDRLLGSSRPEIHKPDIYRRAAESLTTIANKDVVIGTKVDMSVPPLSAEDLQELTEPDNLTVGELENLRDVLQKKIVNEDLKSESNKPKHRDTKIKPRVEKVYKDPDTQFGNLLSSIDYQILGKKDERRSKSLDKKQAAKKDETMETKKNETSQPVFKRLADKYNPRPRKNSADVVERPAPEPEKPAKIGQQIEVRQSNREQQVWAANNFQKNFRSNTGNTFMNTFIVQNNQFQPPPPTYHHNPPAVAAPKVFHPYEPIQSNEIVKTPPVDYYSQHNNSYQNQRRMYTTGYNRQFADHWTPPPPRREDPRLVMRDPRIRAREIKEKMAHPIQTKRKSLDEHSKFDSLYSDRTKAKEETFVSPLDSLYSAGGETSQKTGKGYGMQKFRIPKKKLELDEFKPIEDEPESKREEIEDTPPVKEEVIEKVEAKASLTDESIIAGFISNLIERTDKKNILSALVTSLTGGVSDPQTKKFKRIQKIINSDSDDEDEEEVKPDIKPEPKKEEVPVKKAEEDQKQVEDEEKEEKKAVAVKTKKSQTRKSLRKKIDAAAAAEPEKLAEEEKLEAVVETVGERIKNRKRNTDTPKRKSTELDKLHKDIKEMFICDGVLTATGKRMCRILKSDHVEEPKDDDLDSPKRRARTSNPKVVIEKTDFSKLVVSKHESESDTEPETTMKTRSSRRKSTAQEPVERNKTPPKRTRAKPKPNYSEPDEEISSVASSVEEKEDTETSTESPEKTKKRRRRGHNWAIGIITKKSAKKKIASPIATPIPEPEPPEEPILHDKEYYYDPREKSDCRVCQFKGKFIVQHYRTTHPTHEVLISRISPENARKAIEESHDSNLAEVVAVDQWESEARKKRFNYQCRFCDVFFKNESTENFFDHTTSHTGEYRFHCRICNFKTANAKSLRAHFHSSHSNSHDHIGTVTPTYATPPNFAMLFGYICESCHYVQLNRDALVQHVEKFHAKGVEICKINMSTVINKITEEPVPEPEPVTEKPTEIPEPEKKEDLTVFKPNVELANDAKIMDEQKQEKMTEINKNIVPKKKFSFDLLDKIKSRLEDKVDEKPEEPKPVEVESSVQTPIAKDVVETKPEPETKKPKVKVETKPVVLNKNSVPITNIIERLQGKLNMDAQPPPLIPINTFALNVEPKIEEVQIQVGPIVAKNKKDYTLYMCYMLSCMFSSTEIDEFDAHCANMHGNKQWDGYCSVCDVNTGLGEVQEAFHHLLLAHKNDIGDERKNESEIKTYLRMRRLSGDKLSDMKTEPENPVISMSDESPFKIVNVQARVEDDVEEENFFPFQISSVTTLTPEEDQALNTPQPVNTTLAVLNATPIMMLPLLTPLPATKPKTYGSPTKPITLKKNVVLTDVPLQPHEMLAPRKTPVAMNSLLTEQKLMHLYKCPKKVCTFSSNIKRLFEIHLRQHEEFKAGVEVPCLYCNYKCDVTMFTLHYDLRHGRCQYCCVYCFYRAINQCYVEMHQEREHPKSSRKVLVAPLTTDAITTQSQPPLQPMKALLPLYVCGKVGCNKKFIFSADFVNHYDFAHGVGLNTCTYCSYVPTNGSDAVDHMTAHNVCRFHCRYCQYGGKTSSEVYHHLSLQHPAMATKIVERIFIPDIKNIAKTSMDYHYDDPATYDRLHIITNEFSKYVTPGARIAYATYSNNRVTSLSSPTKKETITLYKAPNSDKIELVETKTRPASPLVLNQFLKTSGDILSLTKNLPNQSESETPSTPAVIILEPETNDIQNKKSAEPVVEVVDNEKRDVIDSKTKPDQSEATNSSNITEEELSDFTTDESSFSESSNKTQGLIGKELFRCSFCSAGFDLTQSFKAHVIKCVELNKVGVARPYSCNHCNKCFKTVKVFLEHIRVHGKPRFACSLCEFKHAHQLNVRTHMKTRHSVTNVVATPVDPTKNNIEEDDFTMRPKLQRMKSADGLIGKDAKTMSIVAETGLEFGPEDIASVPLRPIFNQEVKCSTCGYGTKVRANLIRHFQFHKTGKELPIPATAPVNPVPCLDKNEKMFDKMTNLSLSSYKDVLRKGENKTKTADATDGLPMFVPSTKRYTCGANNCDYLCLEESMLRSHLQALHSDETEYRCTHCHEDLSKEKGAINIDQILKHLRLHDLHLYKCHHCKFMHYFKHKVDRHVIDKHNDPMIIIVRELDHEPEEAKAHVVQEEIKETKPWRCGMCKYRCSSNDDIVTHVFNKHDLDSQFKCALCQYRSNVKQVIRMHFEKDHPGQPGISNSEIHQHSKRAHPNMDPLVVSVPMPSEPTIKPIARKRKYPKPDSTITSSSDDVQPKIVIVDNDSLPEDEDQTVVCGYCTTRCPSIPEMRAHWELVHKDKGLGFKYKETEFNKKGMLNYKCSYCAFIGPLEAMKSHFKNVHPNLSFSVYRYSHYKVAHNDPIQTCFDIHDPDGPAKDFVCKFCNLDFDDRSELEEHHSTFHSHLDLNLPPSVVEVSATPSSPVEAKKTYKCPAMQCAFFSNNYGSMREHVRSHAKPFQCGNCPTRGIYPSFVKTHHNKEHPELEFKCSSSPEGVALYNNLKQNILQLNKNNEYEVMVNKQKKVSVPRTLPPPAVASPPPPKKMKTVARKSTTTPVKPIVRKQTARKSTTPAPRPKTPDYGFSYYGTKPDMDGAENLNTWVMLGHSHLKINFTQLCGLFDMVPTVPVIDLKYGEGHEL